MKALLVYGTRYGATKSTSQEITNLLQDKGVEVKIVDSKKEKMKDISSYELVIVASGMKMGRWTREPESFLQKFTRELASKKLRFLFHPEPGHYLSMMEIKRRLIKPGMIIY